MKFNKELLKGSAILLVSFGIFNLFNFIFQFSMARLLTIAEYGILAAIFSILYIFGIFYDSIQLVVAKYTAAEDNDGKLKNIFKKTLKKSFKFSIMVFIVYLFAAIFLSLWLKIPYSLLALSGLAIFFVFLIPVTRGVLQGRKKFTSLGINMAIESVTKVVVGVALVLFGLGLYGAVGALVAGVVFALLTSFLGLRKIMKSKEEKSITPKIYNYSWPVFIAILTISAFYLLDIIIAKIVFSPEVAGYYAIASMLAKTIFWGTQPISKAMFPISAEEVIRKKPKKNVYSNAMIILIPLLIIALVIFYFFPGILVRVFSGRYIIESSSALFYLAIGNVLVAFANLNILYNLSLGKTKRTWTLLGFVVLEVILLFYFSQNIFQFSIAFITASAALLWGSITLMKE